MSSRLNATVPLFVVDLCGRLSNHDLDDLDPCPVPSAQPTRQKLGRVAYERQKHVRLTRAEVGELAAAYQAGASVPELATSYGIHRTTVLLHLERYGIQRRSAGPKLTEEEVRQAAAFYAEGESLATVATRFGVNASTIKRGFDKVGVKTRPGPADAGRPNRQSR